MFLDFSRGDTTKLQIFDAVYPTKCSTVSFILSSFLKFNTIITTTNHDERDHVIMKLIFWKENILPKRGIIITGKKLNKSKVKKKTDERENICTMDYISYDYTISTIG